MLGPRTKPQPGFEHVEVFLTQFCHAGPAFLLPSQQSCIPIWEPETLRKNPEACLGVQTQQPPLGSSAGVRVALQRSLPLVIKQNRVVLGTQPDSATAI